MLEPKEDSRRESKTGIRKRLQKQEGKDWGWEEEKYSVSRGKEGEGTMHRGKVSKAVGRTQKTGKGD